MWGMKEPGWVWALVLLGGSWLAFWLPLASRLVGLVSRAPRPCSRQRQQRGCLQERLACAAGAGIAPGHLL